MSIMNATEAEKLAWKVMVHIIPSFNIKWQAYNINFDYTSEDKKFITVSFNVKKFYGWKFGMWIDISKDDNENNDEDKDIIKVFMQHKDWIDNFTPMHSGLCVGIDRWIIENEYSLKDPFYNLHNMLIYVKKHPIMAYSDVEIGNGVYDLTAPTIKFYASQKYMHWWKFNNANKIYTKLALWYCNIKIKLIKLFDCKYIKSIKIIDELTDPFTSVSPRYAFEIIFNKNATEADECNFLNRWFHKNQYGYRNITSDYIQLQYKNENSDRYYVYTSEKEN